MHFFVDEIFKFTFNWFRKSKISFSVPAMFPDVSSVFWPISTSPSLWRTASRLFWKVCTFCKYKTTHHGKFNKDVFVHYNVDSTYNLRNESAQYYKIFVSEGNSLQGGHQFYLTTCRLERRTHVRFLTSIIERCCK